MKTLLSEDSLVFNPPELGCVLCMSGLPGSGNKLYDRSPYGNTGTITGATWVRLPGGLWCLSFDGTDDYVENTTPSGMDFAATDSFTVKAWVKLTANASYKCVLSRHYYTANEPYIAVLISDAGKGYIQISDGTVSRDLTANTDVADSSWHQVVAIRDTSKDQLLFYLDGESDATPVTDTTTGAIANTGKMRLGRTVDNAYAWAGSLALVELHRRPFNVLEIQNSFNREKHLFGVW